MGSEQVLSPVCAGAPMGICCGTAPEVKTPPRFYQGKVEGPSLWGGDNGMKEDI